MSKLNALFEKPFQVTQFWSSDKYLIHQSTNEDLVADFVIDEPEPGTWYFGVSNGPGTRFIGDTFAPFLPTRHNIAVLNSGCVKASVLLEKYKANELTSPPQKSVFASITPYPGVLARNLNNTKYQRDLFLVLQTDWGIELPPLSELGRRDVVFAYKPGLPCAAAMTRAVQPILEVVRGPLKRVRQGVSHEGNKVFDTLEYQDSSGGRFTQRFDITEYFGQQLPDTNFLFEEEGIRKGGEPAEGIDGGIVDEMSSIINLWAGALRRGKTVREITKAVFLSHTKHQLHDHDFKDPIEFCDFITFAKTGRLLTDEEVIALGVRAQQQGLDVRKSERIRAIASALKGKSWWQFWK